MVMITSTKTNLKKNVAKSFGDLPSISRDKQKELMINLYMFSSSNMATMKQRETRVETKPNEKCEKMYFISHGPVVRKPISLSGLV